MSEKEQQIIFEQWLDQYRRLIVKILRVYAATPMDRDDLFQDICVQLWRSVPSFRGNAATSTWVYRIALNVSIKWIRKAKKEEFTEPPAEGLLKEESPSEDDRLAWLHREVSLLNPIDKSVALLLLDGFSYKEISVIAGISESLVGVKINRIKKQLVEKSKIYKPYGI